MNYITAAQPKPTDEKSNAVWEEDYTEQEPHAAAIGSIRRSYILLELALYTQGLAILIYLIPKAFA